MNWLFELLTNGFFEPQMGGFLMALVLVLFLGILLFTFGGYLLFISILQNKYGAIIEGQLIGGVLCTIKNEKLTYEESGRLFLVYEYAHPDGTQKIGKSSLAHNRGRALNLDGTKKLRLFRYKGYDILYEVDRASSYKLPCTSMLIGFSLICLAVGGMASVGFGLISVAIAILIKYKKGGIGWSRKNKSPEPYSTLVDMEYLLSVESLKPS